MADANENAVGTSGKKARDRGFYDFRRHTAHEERSQRQKSDDVVLPASSKEKLKVEEVAAHTEKFDNSAHDGVQSPDSQSPDLPDEKATELIYHAQMAPAHFTFQTTAERYGALYATSFGFIGLFQVPSMCIQYGTLQFLCMYIVMSTFIAVPLAYMQLAVGQYSSLPPLQLFTRMTPLWKGLGVLITMVRVATMFFTFDDMLVQNLLNTVLMMGTKDTAYARCDIIGFPGCYKRLQTCPRSSNVTYYAYLGQCLPLFVNGQPNWHYTAEQIVVAMTYSHPAMRETPLDTFIWNNLKDTPNVLVVTASFLCMTLLLGVAWLGKRFFGWVSFVFSVSTVLIFAAIAANHLFTAVPLIFRELIHLHSHSFYTYQFYIDVFSMVVFSYGLADGTLLLIGSFTKFNNNTLGDVMFLYCSNIISFVLILLAMLPSLVQLSMSKYPEHEIFPNFQSRLRLLGVMSRAEFHLQFVDVNMYAGAGMVFSGLLTFVLSVMQVCPQIVTVELVMQSIINSSRYFVHFDMRTMVLRFYCMYMLCTTLCSVGRDAAQHGQGLVRSFGMDLITYCLIPSVLLLQALFIVHPYSSRRLATNIHTMTGVREHRDYWRIFGWLRPTSRFWHFSWTIVVPVAALVNFIGCQYKVITDNFVNKRREVPLMLTLRSATYGLLLFVMLGTMPAFATAQIRKVKNMGRHLRSLLEPDPTWGPLMYSDRKQAEFDERAARVRG